MLTLTRGEPKAAARLDSGAPPPGLEALSQRNVAAAGLIERAYVRPVEASS